MPASPARVVVGLGANLGDAHATLVAAVRVLERRFRLLAVSSLYETAAVGPPQPDYLNAAALLSTDVAPLTLLSELLGIERDFGRVRRERHGPRTLDLDVLWIDGTVVDEPGLTVPHPRLAGRRFSLEPLLEVAPEARHPATGKPLADFLEALPPGGIRKVAEPDWAAPTLSAD